MLENKNLKECLKISNLKMLEQRYFEECWKISNLKMLEQRYFDWKIKAYRNVGRQVI